MFTESLTPSPELENSQGQALPFTTLSNAHPELPLLRHVELPPPSGS